MRKAVLLFAVAIAMCGGRGHGQDFEIMTGTWGGRYACEALLCLSSGARPGECSPALNFYYSIHGATPADTIALRIAFLLSCPTGGGAGLEVTGGDSEQNYNAYMSEQEKSELVNVIVHGESGVNVTETPQPYVDPQTGEEYPANWHTVVDTNAGTAYRNHPGIVNVPDDRGLYINGQRTETRGGKVYVGDTEYRMNNHRQYVAVR